MRAYARRHQTVISRTPPFIERRRRAPRKPLRSETPRLTIAAAVDLYLSLLPTMVNRRGRLYMPRTVGAYAEVMRPFGRWCGDRTVTELSADLMQRYIGELRHDGLAQWTLATRDKVLRIWLGWCVERGIIGRSPVAGVRRLAAADPPIETLTADEVGQLVSSCNRLTWGGSRDAAILFALWRTGVRASELARLEVEDYDRRGRLLRVRHGKGDTHRLVGVPDDAAAAIDEFVILMRGEETGALFPSERGGPLNRDSVMHLVARIGRRAGVAGVHPHRFRHTFACDFLLAGGDSAILMRLLGHSSMAMTMRYLRAVQQLQAATQHVETMRRNGRGRRR